MEAGRRCSGHNFGRAIPLIRVIGAVWNAVATSRLRDALSVGTGVLAIFASWGFKNIELEGVIFIKGLRDGNWN